MWRSSRYLWVLLAAIAVGASFPAMAYGPFQGKWPQANLGDPVYLTYSYQNLLDGGLLDPAGDPVPESQIRRAIEEAFSVWAAVAPLHFTEVPDDGLPYGQSTQFGVIRFRQIYINGPDPPTGNPTTKAQARFPGTSLFAGDVDFDHSDPWQLIGTIREPDILGAAIHELGHSLGLTHSDVVGSNLYWIFRRFAGPGTGELHPDDLAAITALYGTGRGSVTPLVRIPEPTGVALALGGVVALLALRRRSCTERVGFRGP